MPKSHSSESDRNIATYYFTDATKNYIIKTIWSKYPRSAVQRAADRLSMNDLGASVAVIYDDAWGQDHAIITRSIEGVITIQYRRDQTKSAIAGTSRDPFGEFVKKIAKSRQSIEAKVTSVELMRKLRIKTGVAHV